MESMPRAETPAGHSGRRARSPGCSGQRRPGADVVPCSSIDPVLLSWCRTESGSSRTRDGALGRRRRTDCYELEAIVDRTSHALYAHGRTPTGGRTRRRARARI
eukprot:6696217-Prymnesium_polylepis.2